MKRRAQFNQFLSSNTSLTVNRYFRLMCLATAELIFSLPVTTYGLYLNITTRPIYPWKSWSDIHFDWYTIDTFPAVLWRASHITIVNLELSRWSLVLCAFVFFGFFGFADEARRHYRVAFWAVAKRFGVVPPPSPLSSKFSSGLVSPSVLGVNLLNDPRLISPKGDFKPEISLPVFTPHPLQLTSTKADSAPSLSDRTSYTKSEYTETLHGSPTSPDFKKNIQLMSTTPSTSSHSIYELYDRESTKYPHSSV